MLPKFDPKQIPKNKISIPELIGYMQDQDFSQDHIAKMTGYGCGNCVAQLKHGTRTPGRKKLGTFYRLSGGKLDLNLYLK